MAQRKGVQMSEAFRTALFLTLSGGFQDAYTYCCRGGVFANAQTGNIVLMSTYLFSGAWMQALKYMAPLAAFVLGIFTAEVIHRRFKLTHTLHWRQLVLIFEIALLFAVGFIPISWNTLANVVVSFVCAMQVQTFRKVRGSFYASTMCIGNMRSGTEALCAYFCTKDRTMLKKALRYFGLIALFAVGAGVGGVLAVRMGIRSIWISCVLLTAGFFIMFIKPSDD